MGPNYGSGYTNYYGQPAPKKFLNKTVLMIGGIVAVLIIAVFGIINLSSAGGDLKTQTAHLSARLTNLAALTVTADSSITGGDTKKLNAEVHTITLGAQGQLGSTFPKKVDKKITAAEADTTSADKLQAAGLAGTYDATYKEVMTAKLESINALIGEMFAKTKDAETKAKLNEIYKDYGALQTRLSTF